MARSHKSTHTSISACAGLLFGDQKSNVRHGCNHLQPVCYRLDPLHTRLISHAFDLLLSVTENFGNGLATACMMPNLRLEIVFSWTDHFFPEQLI